MKILTYIKHAAQWSSDGTRGKWIFLMMKKQITESLFMQHGQRTVTLFDFFICDYTGSDDDDDDDESDSEYVTTDELPVVSCSLQQGLKQSVCVCV